MSKVLDGIGASEGIGAGRVHILNWGVPDVPHRLIEPEEVEKEEAHLREVFAWAKTRLLELEDSTEERLGTVEARIFEPQVLMLEDETLIEGATLYIRENRLSAARALDWRMLELQAKRHLADGASTAVDIVPQLQISLNTRQHVLANVGVLLPATQTTGRSARLLVYVLLDWFDGGFFEGW